MCVFGASRKGIGFVLLFIKMYNIITVKYIQMKIFINKKDYVNQICTNLYSVLYTCEYSVNKF